MESTLLRTQISSRFGALGLAWRETPSGPRVARIFLPNEWLPELGGADTSASAPIADLAARIEAYLAGEPVTFDLDLLLLEQCSEFRRRVLLAEFGIPRGWVSTYARVARHLQSPRAARAVGMALGGNPFPIVIPCHRAVRSDGGLGGYRGGLAMKRALLEMEGVRFQSKSRVRLDKIWY